MANDVFKKSSGRRVSVAAAAFAACLTMSPVLFAQTSYTGTDNVSGPGVFDTTITTDHTVNNGSTLNVQGGSALPTGATGTFYGGGALKINGDFRNNGISTIEAGVGGENPYKASTSRPAYGGTGMEVDGDVYNSGDLQVTGGLSETDSGNTTIVSNGGTGLKALNGTIYNQAGVITAEGGMGYNHSARGGHGIEAKSLNNSAVINTTGGYSTMDTMGGGGFPMGGHGMMITDDMINNASGTITATGGEGDMHTTCGHAGMGGNGLMVGGGGENYGILSGFGGTAAHHATGGTATGGIGMTFGSLVTNYSTGEVLAIGGTPNTGGNAARRGGTGINFGGGIINHSNLFRAEGASASNTGSGLVTGGHGMTLGPEQFWTSVSNTTFDVKMENHGTIEILGGDAHVTGTAAATGGMGMGISSYFWRNDGVSFSNVEIVNEVINHGKIYSTAGNAVSTSNAAATGGGGLIMGTTSAFSNMTLTYKSSYNYGTMIARGGDAESTSTGSSTGGTGMWLRGGTYNYGDMVATGGLQLNGGGTGTETAGTGMILYDGLTNYEGSYLTLLGNRSSTYTQGGAAVQLGGTPLGTADDLSYGAWFKKGSFLSLGNADYAASLNSGAYIDANGLAVVFENDDPTWPEALVISPATSSLAVGGKVTHTDFIVNTSSDWGTAAGQVGIASYTGPVMDVTISQTANGANFNYTYEAERIAWSSQYLENSTAGNLIAGLEQQIQGVTIDESNYDWANVLASVDFQPGVQELRKQANYVYNATMSPNTAQAMQSMAQAGRALDSMFSRNMQSLGKYGVGSDWAVPVCSNTDYYYGYAEGPDCCSEYCKPAWLWLQPFYYTGTQKAKASYFNDLDEDYVGMTLGFAQDLGPFVLALSGHYYSGDLDAKHYDGDVDGYGFEIGIGRAFRATEYFNPWVELRAGYTWLDFDQTRRDVNGNKIKSSPDGDLFYAGLKMNNDYQVSERWTLTPSIGVDYMRMSLDSYKEKGNSGLLLNVDPENYDSLRGQLGLDATFAATDSLYLKLRGAYNYEFGDRNAEIMVRAQNLGALKTKVTDKEFSRHSGTAGAGLGYVFCDNASIGLDYDAHFSDQYIGHQVTGRLVFSF